MTIRHGTDDDLEAVQRLWELWQSDSPAPPPWADASWDANRAEFERALAANALFLAEEDGEVFGFVSSWLEEHVGRIGDLYVVKSGRREGAGRALVEAVIENLRARGATHLILSANLEALPFYEKLGFREDSRNLVLPLEVRAVGGGRSFGSIHIQTDDIGAIERAIRQFVPRLPGGSNGSIVAPPRNGWIAVYDDVCDRDPSMLRRLARELSERTGAVVLARGGRARAGRPLHPVRSRSYRRRVSLRSRALWRVAARRRDRSRCESTRRSEAHGRRSGRGPRRGPYGPVPRGAAAAAGASCRHRRCDRTRGRRARLGRCSEDPECGRGGQAVITLFDAARCPYCARVRIVLAEKDVPYDPVEIDLTDRPAWLFEKNPVGKVPVLEEDGWVLPESAVIAEFLNERYPEPPLWPADPGERAAARLIVFRFEDFSKPYYAFRRGEEGALARFEEELGFLDVLLQSTPWLSGRAFGLADVAFLPWLLRARDMLGLSLEPWPALSGWLDRACARPSVAAERDLVAAL